MKGFTFDDIPGLTGRTALVTGANTGIGYHIAEMLADRGARVLMGCRDLTKAEAARKDMLKAVPDAQIELVELDLADMASVKAFTAKTLADLNQLDILICNAAVMAELGRSETKDGFEMMFGVNHLAHFAMVVGLLPLLSRSNARVVALSSGAHKYGEFDFDDLQTKGKFKPMVAYGKTKLACLMFAKELQRRSEAQGWGITSVAAHPGFSRSQGVYDRLATIPIMGWIVGTFIIPFISQVPEKASEAILYAATADDVTGGGNYGPVGFRELVGPVGVASTADYAEREDIAARLWAVSEDLTGVRQDDVMAQ